ncbi:MAG: hypothetical protein KKH44_11800, partial [Bacteroidetes bacterium]|nr:hypothetical protein [Bacteroidota bacterium]
MIKISDKEYYLTGVSEVFFWDELDRITAGQATNPEFSYSTQYYANFENIFGGRKVGNKFSVYLYRPITRAFRTEILSKGIVTKIENGIKITCTYEIPFWSLLMFVLIGFLIFTPVFLLSITSGLIFGFIGVCIYSMIIYSNHSNIKEEIKKQFIRI